MDISFAVLTLKGTNQFKLEKTQKTVAVPWESTFIPVSPVMFSTELREFAAHHNILCRPLFRS